MKGVEDAIWFAETAAPELRKTITSLPQIRIVAELDEPSLLGHAASQFPADLLIADLDPNAAVVIECIKQLREVRPELAVFALSSETEGDVVLKALRAGFKEFLVKPLDIKEFEQAIGRAVQTQPQTKQPGKLISIIGSAGGVGCTTIATNLAIELAELLGTAPKVALVDLDFRFGHVATLLDVHGQFTVADLCSTPEQLDDQMVMKALIKYEQNLYILRRPHSFAQAEMITAAHCANVLSSLQEMCAYVVVDGPTRQDPGGRAVLDSADYNLMVLQLLVTSVRNTDRMMQELGVQGFNPERIQFVCNRVGRESSHLGVDQVETILARKMFALLSDDWKSVSSSINIGQPLKVEFARSKVRQELRKLAMQIHSPETVSEKDGKRGLFGKLLGKGGSRKGPATKPAGGEIVANAT